MSTHIGLQVTVCCTAIPVDFLLTFNSQVKDQCGTFNEDVTRKTSVNFNGSHEVSSETLSVTIYLLNKPFTGFYKWDCVI